MILSLISMLGGGLMRLLPELFGWLNKKTDNAHELAMLDKQLALEQMKGQQQRETIQVQGEIDQTIALLNAQKEALSSQMQKTGLAIVDAMNFLVRPLVTYFFVGLYGIVKLSTIVIACQSTDAWHAILQAWGENDVSIMSGILAFWFVGRVFDKQK